MRKAYAVCLRKKGLITELKYDAGGAHGFDCKRFHPRIEVNVKIADEKGIAGLSD